MTFVKSIKTCFNKFVTASGRASRSEYWWFVLSNAITFGWFGIGSIPTIFAGIRRLHDTGRSGWWVLCPILNIIFMLPKSQKDDNKWGGQPAE